MKHLIKRMLDKAGLTVTRQESRVEIDSPWGPNVLQYALQDLSRQAAEPLTIVQVGAHDGADHDPLAHFLMSGNCRALLIEPMDEPFAILSDRYAGNDRVQTLQMAISDQPGVMEMHYIVDANGAPDLTMFSSFDRATVAQNLAVRQREQPELAQHSLRHRPIRADTLGNVMQEAGTLDVDAIVVDAEGLDARIVSSFLTDGIRPKVIRFEYCNLSRRDFHALRAQLTRSGYEIVRVGVDIYCQQEGLLR